MMFHIWHVLAIIMIFALGFILGNNIRIYKRDKNIKRDMKRWRDLTDEEKKKRIEWLKNR